MSLFKPFAFENVVVSGGGGGAFPLTTAFLSATGITGSANIQALQDFETALTTNSLTGKFTAIYPLIGGNSTAASYNFLNTAQYQVTWNGHVTFYKDGVQSTNYGDAYADTGIPCTSISPNEGHSTVWVLSLIHI